MSFAESAITAEVLASHEIWRVYERLTFGLEL